MVIKNGSNLSKAVFILKETIIYFRWQNRKERPNRFTNHGDMDGIAKRAVRLTSM